MFKIYVLQCEEGKYYVGRTTQSVETRFKQHIENAECSWTTRYKPIGILGEFSTDEVLDEDKYTKRCMLDFGIDNVRGGSYTMINLLPWQIQALNHEFRACSDLCFKCGKDGHFARDCTVINEPPKPANINIPSVPVITEEDFDQRDKETSTLLDKLQTWCESIKTPLITFYLIDHEFQDVYKYCEGLCELERFVARDYMNPPSPVIVPPGAINFFNLFAYKGFVLIGVTERLLSKDKVAELKASVLRATTNNKKH